MNVYSSERRVFAPAVLNCNLNQNKRRTEHDLYRKSSQTFYR